MPTTNISDKPRIKTRFQRLIRNGREDSWSAAHLGLQLQVDGWSTPQREGGGQVSAIEVALHLTQQGYRWT